MTMSIGILLMHCLPKSWIINQLDSMRNPLSYHEQDKMSHAPVWVLVSFLTFILSWVENNTFVVLQDCCWFMECSRNATTWWYWFTGMVGHYTACRYLCHRVGGFQHFWAFCVACLLSGEVSCLPLLTLSFVLTSLLSFAKSGVENLL